MTDRELLELALDALVTAPLDHNSIKSRFFELRHHAIEALRERLAQPEQEPVAWAMYQKGRLLSFWMDKGDAYNFEFTSEHSWSPLYTTPPQRKPLAEKEIAVPITDENEKTLSRKSGVRL